MRVVAVVSEKPSLAQSILTVGLTEQAHHTARLPIALIQLYSETTPAAVARIVAPHLCCRSVAELTATLHQLRYAGADWVFVDCHLAFDTVADDLMALVDVAIVPVAAERRRLDAVSAIVATAQRHDRKVLFALTDAAPSRKTTAACALALARFAPVIPVVIPATTRADTAGAARFAADGINAQLLRAIQRLTAPGDRAGGGLDWPATLWAR